MKKQIALRAIALRAVTVEDILMDFFGVCYSYISPSGSSFFESVDDIEVCMFRSGRLSLCGMGEYRKQFANAMDFKLFVEGYMGKSQYP